MSQSELIQDISFVQKRLGSSKATFSASNSDLSSQGGFLFGGSAQALKAADLEAMKTAIDDEEAESQNVETEAGGNADAEEAPEVRITKTMFCLF